MRKSIKVGTGLALSAALMGGCTSQSAEQEPSYNPTAVSPDEGPRDLPSNPCPPKEFLGQEFYEKQAASCTRVMQTGQIALVGYGLRPKVLDRLADDTEELLRKTTHELVTMDVVPIVASDTAIAGLEAIAPKCIELGDITKHPGYLLNVADPSLDDYGLVAGVTTKKSCDGTGDFKEIKGAASQFAGGRFVTIFEANKKLPKDNKSNGIFSGSQLFDATVATHEILHRFGLGHANELIGSGFNDLVFDNYSEREVYVNLWKMIKKSQLSEYGDNTNLMGSAMPEITKNYNAKYLLNSIQLAWLQEPKFIKEEKESQFVELSKNSMSVSGKQVYTVALPRELSARDFKIGSWTAASDYGESVIYKKLAFTGYGGILDLNLISDTGDTANLGSVYSQTSSKWHLKLGDKMIDIEFNKNLAPKVSVS